MNQSTQHGARPRKGRSLTIAAAVLCATALSQANLAYAGRMAGAAGFMVAEWADFTAAALLAFTGAGSIETDFTTAGSAATDFATADFSSADRSRIPGGAIIRTTDTTTTANPILGRPGITVPTLQAITLM